MTTWRDGFTQPPSSCVPSTSISLSPFSKEQATHGLKQSMAYKVEIGPIYSFCIKAEQYNPTWGIESHKSAKPQGQAQL